MQTATVTTPKEPGAAIAAPPKRTDGKPINAGGGIMVSLALPDKPVVPTAPPKPDKGPAWLKAIATRNAAAAKERESAPDVGVPARAKPKGKPGKSGKRATPRPPKAHAKAGAGAKGAGRAKAHKPAKGKAEARGPSGLDAAATVLKGRDKPMNVRALWDAIKARKLWDTAGATPWQTLSAALQRAPKRFRKAGRGLWRLA